LHACEASPSARAQAARSIRCVGLQARPLTKTQEAARRNDSHVGALSTLSPLARRRWGYWQARPHRQPHGMRLKHQTDKAPRCLFFLVAMVVVAVVAVCVSACPSTPRSAVLQHNASSRPPHHTTPSNVDPRQPRQPLLSSPQIHRCRQWHSIAARCPAQSTCPLPTQAPAYAY
jgi:hypothetical protein